MPPFEPGLLEYAIELDAVTKRYGETVALDGLDLNVPCGGCFGLLGPNGAGKSTTVSICATLLIPDSGTVRVLGKNSLTEFSQLRHDIGIVFQEPSLDRELTAREHLELQARLYHLRERRKTVALALARVSLEADADRPVHGFSGGMRRRLEIARGLLHQPRLLFLDEPTLGLDVVGRAAIWQQLRFLADAETTVFLTTHSMEEADALCSRIAIVDRGRIVAQGAPDQLKAELGGDVVRITLRDGHGVLERFARSAQTYETTIESQKDSGATVLRIVTTEGPNRLPALLDIVRDFGIEEVRLERPTLEHVFLHHTGHAFDLGEPSPV